MSDLDDFDEELVYNFQCLGSFGRFQSGNSFPVEFVMTSFPATELGKLTFARDIRPDEIDFELLMQRDIDLDRVRKKIEPYLQNNNQSRAVFFPPLLAAIIPAQGSTMLHYYPDRKDEVAHDDAGKERQLTKEWPGFFKLTFSLSNAPTALRQECTLEGKLDERFVKREPVKLELRLSDSGQTGARLVVIDGQHRLYALNEIPSGLKQELIVPVCIVYAPNSTSAYKSQVDVEIPKVSQVFRNLFVDVNTTAELVGGHFNILLSDQNIGDFTCRLLCSETLGERGSDALGVIEWNTKTQKDSTRILREYSLTSIGVIELALRKSVGEKRRKALLKYLLNLEEVSQELNPADADSIDYPKVEWNNFSLSQKNILAQQASKYLTPCLKQLFFETEQFKDAYEIFSHEIGQLRSIADGNSPDKTDAREVLHQVVDYIPIKEGKMHESARNVYRKFEMTVEQRRLGEVADIIKYAIFQRAMIEAWCQALEVVRLSRCRVEPVNATKAFVSTLNYSLRDDGKSFKETQEYMQYSIFKIKKIKPTEATRKALADLILANLANKDQNKIYVDSLGCGGEEKEDLAHRLIVLGEKAAGQFLKYFATERRKAFIDEFTVDTSIDIDDREALQQKLADLEKQKVDVRAGKLEREKIQDEFTPMVDGYVKGDIEIAAARLKEVLGYSSDILLEGEGDDNSDNGEYDES